MTRTVGNTDPIPLDDDFFADPDALYRRLRVEAPVTRIVAPPGLVVWLVTRYADVRPALNDARLAKNGRRFQDLIGRHTAPTVRMAEFANSLVEHMLNSDPPDHTRLRKLVNRAFTVRAIAQMRPRITEIATELADSMTAHGPEVDLLDEFAFPLPMTVICELLGVPQDRRDEFRTWSNTLLSAGEPEERSAAAQAMAQFLAELVAQKTAQPGEDMLSAIVAASEDGDRLSHIEVISMAFLLLVAGHETTVNLIGNGMLALLRRPDQLAALRADPSLVPNAVEEFLRFDGPVNLATMRHTSAPVEIGGVTIPEGELVLVSLIGANRDPGRFERPDELDVTRDTSGHVAFGYGIHHCLGAPLARLEGEIAFRTLLDRFPDIELAAEPASLAWRESSLIHGLHRLPVRF
ncbi:cytochrome P450 family protein [Pseudonocardia dioxanivorans]|uniref:Peroxidase n=1 Tax=Pseudonocardia dioxanivorans (strain ATCC 55486 / DSM 44775 / JCM 13855 / CB1190) TaxID=675635 RepID=F4CLB6_PSEUX|nr:cytochrome P450 [Pseudonocardia dioxanivorans]AEA25958.1 Peroxidase [Pseudonocardia dioxanivorans CB1190]